MVGWDPYNRSCFGTVEAEALTIDHGMVEAEALTILQFDHGMVETNI